VPRASQAAKIITNGFRSTRLLRQGRLRKSDDNCKPAGQKAARVSQANGAVGLAGLQNQNKRFWVYIVIEFFRARKLDFLKNNFNTTTQRRISRRAFWLILKNS
jgi:hypothetical protein